ncbi:hypothetical protein LOK49_LG01G02962 [Camellia lanceoleosa]|uniref:Uncharacterized protein n=1 Tax=Camellia lanceoleosa TaxID=1840588 RepID=A0ACC0IZG8_9ERIC|nr:hypothetical protein LOK49_LG01G02962 [Camellia lanceoleosa]
MWTSLNLSPGVFSSTKTHPRAATPKSSGFPTNSRNSVFCYDCGRIGHDNTVCKFTSRESGRRSCYAPDLKVERGPLLKMTPEQTRMWVDKMEAAVKASVDDGRRKFDFRPPELVLTKLNTTTQVVGSSTSSGNVAAPPAPNRLCSRSAVPEGGKGYPQEDKLDTLVETPPNVLDKEEGLMVGHRGLNGREEAGLTVEAQKIKSPSEQPSLGIAIEDVSPNVSPNHVSVNPLVESCMAHLFKDLTLKRKLEAALPPLLAHSNS